jgi:hypothetical protein
MYAAQVPNLTGVIDWPAWLTAVGTVGAFAIALYLLGIQMFSRRSESRERRMAQARCVSAWVSEMIRPADNGHFRIDVLARNSSDQPVYGVSIKLEVGVRGSFLRQPVVLGPEETRKFSIEVPSYPRGFPGVSIAFTDSAGRQWLRTGPGVLRNPTFDEILAHQRQSPGAYPDLAHHPTVALGNSPEAQRGQRVIYGADAGAHLSIR